LPKPGGFRWESLFGDKREFNINHHVKDAPMIALNGNITTLQVTHEMPDRKSHPPGRTTRRRRTKPVRLIDIARASGVSIATVSMVVNGNARISPATAKRVRKMIDKLGYRPHRAAHALSLGQRPPTLAVLLPARRQAFADSYFGELISGIGERAAALGHVIIFEHVTAEFLRANQHRTMLEQRSVDGLLLLGFGDFDRFVDDLADDAAAVVVDSAISRCAVDSVSCDYRSGAQQAMNYLLQLGHRRIGLITATGGRCGQAVVEVYRSSMASYGVRPGEGWIADGHITEAGGELAAEKILRRHPDVTAIFAASDPMATGAIHYAARRQMSVPHDLSVIGFDGLSYGAFMNPPLSTVRLPLAEVGARACERLIERIGGRREVIADRLPIHLVVRESTALAKDLPPAGTVGAA
jgi:LacI family transcriptional regulator